MFPFAELCVSCPLHSTYFHTLLHYYETVRLLTSHLLGSVYKTLTSHTLSRACEISRVPQIYFASSPRSWTPTEPPHPCHVVCGLLPAAKGRASASAFYHHEAESLYAFALRLACSPASRLNLTSRLRLQKWVRAVGWTLPDPAFHRAIYLAPNRRTPVLSAFL